MKKKVKGIYILIIWLDKERRISIGRLGLINFNRGLYFYVGSAFNGMENRIKRHFRKRKKLFWHIDYFLKFAKILDVITVRTNQREAECMVAGNLLDRYDSIKGFGSSDCRCESHLFFKGRKQWILKK